MDDIKILALLWERAEQALVALAARFGPLLHRICMNILNNESDTEETINDTYLALWNAIPPERPDPLTGYVCRVGRNTALNRLRADTAQKRNSRYDLSLEELSGCLPGQSLEDEIDAKLLGRAIDRFLDTLSRNSRIMFLRRYWFGDSTQEIAKLFSTNENAVCVRLHRIRTQLRAYLIKEGCVYDAKAK